MKNTFLVLIILVYTSCLPQKTVESDATELATLTEEYVEEMLYDETEEEEEEYYDESLEIPEDYNKCLEEDQDELMPTGFCRLEKIEGDLNKDGLDDYILIIKDTKREAWEINQLGKMVDRNRRGIIIALMNKDGKFYQQSVANYACFESENEDGGVYFAPEMLVEINEKGNLIIHYSHGRYGYWFYTFRFQNNTFELIGFESHSHHGPIAKSITSINFSTQKKKTSVNVSEDEDSEKWEHTWEDIEVEELISLEKITSLAELSF